MILFPRKVKYRKWQRRGHSRSFKASRGAELSFGSFGLKATEGGLISARQIESARRAMVRYIKKGGKIWIRIFPDKPITTKGVEVPMGGGKGSVDHYVAPIKPGRLLFEIDGIPKEVAVEAIKRAGDKLPIKTKFVTRHH